MITKKISYVFGTFLMVASLYLIVGQVQQVRAGFDTIRSPISYVYTIKGTITDKETGRPISSVALKAIHKPSDETFEGTTDQNGAYLIVVYGRGKYRVVPSNINIKRFWPVYEAVQVFDNITGLNFTGTAL